MVFKLRPIPKFVKYLSKRTRAGSRRDFDALKRRRKVLLNGYFGKPHSRDQIMCMNVLLNHSDTMEYFWVFFYFFY